MVKHMDIDNIRDIQVEEVIEGRIYSLISVMHNDEKRAVKLSETGQITELSNINEDNRDSVLRDLLKATLREKIGGGEEEEIDIGFNDPVLYLSTALAVPYVNHANLRLFNFFPNGPIENNYFETNNPSTVQFRERLGLDGGSGVAMVPITVYDHYSVLFIERDGEQRIRLFDTGLGHVDDIEEAEQVKEQVKEQEEVLQRTFGEEETSHGSEIIFGNGGLSNDIIPLNFHILQGEQTCGYFSLAAMQYVSENNLSMQQIIDQSQQGIFQVHVTQIMLERLLGDDQQIIKICEQIDDLDNDTANYTIYQQKIVGENRSIRVAIKRDIKEIHIPAREGLEKVELDQIIDLGNIEKMLTAKGFQGQVQNMQQENALNVHGEELDYNRPDDNLNHDEERCDSVMNNEGSDRSIEINEDRREYKSDDNRDNADEQSKIRVEHTDRKMSDDQAKAKYEEHKNTQSKQGFMVLDSCNTSGENCSYIKLSKGKSNDNSRCTSDY